MTTRMSFRWGKSALKRPQEGSRRVSPLGGSAGKVRDWERVYHGLTGRQSLSSMAGCQDQSYVTMPGCQDT